MTTEIEEFTDRIASRTSEDGEPGKPGFAVVDKR